MKVPINAIAMAANESTIDHLVVESEARRYVDVVVKVLAVHEQLIRSIGKEMASWLRAMMMPDRSKDAGYVRASLRIVGGESFGLAQTIRRRYATLSILQQRIRC